MSTRQKSIFILLIIICMCSCENIKSIFSSKHDINLYADAGEIFTDLIITEVFLDKNNQEYNWFEVYNPTDKGQYVQVFGLSNIRTPNLLPRKDDKGILIKPKEVVVFCADLKRFRENYDKLNTQCIELKALTLVSSEGGYFMISSQKHKETRGNNIRYGNPGQSINRKNIAGDEIIDFSSEKSYSRKIIINKNSKYLMKFDKTIPNPGYIV